MDLQTTLSKIATTNSIPGIEPGKMREASAAAKELSVHLSNAFNANTGKIDLTKFNKSLQNSQTNVTALSSKLLQAGTVGDQAFLKLAQSIAAADRPMITLNAQVSKLMQTFANTVRWTITSAALNTLTGAWQSMIGYAEDLNESLNDIRIVTGYSADRMADFAQEANKAAKTLSTTTTEYTKASLIFFQQGLSDSEVKERTDVTIKLANAAKESVETVSDQLTAVWNNFYDGSKSLEYYADVLTKLGAATASSTDEIAGGLEKFAAVANTIGLSYEYAASALATITSNTRESEDVVGTALKTIFSRIQDLDQGETLDDGTTLGQYSEALHKYGIEVLDAAGNLRAMDDILDDMAARWDSLSSAQQVALAQAVAGVRQYNQIVALMANWNTDDADSMVANLGYTENAEGELQAQADIYAESWEAARDRVTAAAEGIYSDIIDDKFMIKLTDTFASLLESVEAFIDGIGGIKTALIGVSGIVMSMLAPKVQAGINSLVSGLEIAFTGRSQAAERVTAETIGLAKQQFDYKKYDTSTKEGLDMRHAIGTMEMRNQISQATDLTETEKQRYELELQMYDIQKKAVELAREKEKEAEKEKESLEKKKDQLEEINEQRQEELEAVKRANELALQARKEAAEKQREARREAEEAKLKEAEIKSQQANQSKTSADKNLVNAYNSLTNGENSQAISQMLAPAKKELERLTLEYDRIIVETPTATRNAAGKIARQAVKTAEDQVKALEKNLKSVVTEYKSKYLEAIKQIQEGKIVKEFTLPEAISNQANQSIDAIIAEISVDPKKREKTLITLRQEVLDLQQSLEQASGGTVDLSESFNQFRYASLNPDKMGAKELIKYLEQLKSNIGSTKIDFNELEGALQKFGLKNFITEIKKAQKEVEKAALEATQAEEAFEKLKAEQASSGSQENSSVEATQAEIDKLTAAQKRAETAAKNLAEAKKKLAEANTKATNAEKKHEEAQKNLVATQENFKPEHQIKTLEALTSALGGVSSVVFGLNSLNSAIQAINNQDLSGIEKLTTIITSLSFGLPNMINGAGAIRKGITGIKGNYQSLKDKTLAKRDQSLSLIDSADQEISSKIKGYAQRVQEQPDSITDEEQQAMYDLVEKQKALKVEKELLANKKIGIKETLLATAATKQNEATEKGATVATKLWSTATKFLSQNIALMAIEIAAAIAVIYLIVKAIQHFIKVLDYQKKSAEYAAEAAKTLKEAYKEAAEAAEELKSAISDWDSGVKALEDLTKGTYEYEEALDAANKKAKELIETYGLYSNYTYDTSSGAIIIDDQALKDKQAELNDKASIALQASYQASMMSLQAESSRFTTKIKGSRWNGEDNGLDLDLVNYGFSEDIYAGVKQKEDIGSVEKKEYLFNTEQIKDLSKIIEKQEASGATFETFASALGSQANLIFDSEDALNEFIKSIKEASSQLNQYDSELDYYQTQYLAENFKQNNKNWLKQVAGEDNLGYQSTLAEAVSYAIADSVTANMGDWDAAKYYSNAEVSKVLDLENVLSDEELLKEYLKREEKWADSDFTGLEYSEEDGYGVLTDAEGNPVVKYRLSTARSQLVHGVALEEAQESQDVLNAQANAQIAASTVTSTLIEVLGEEVGQKTATNVFNSIKNKDFTSLISGLTPEQISELSSGNANDILSYFGLNELSLKSLGESNAETWLNSFKDALKNYDFVAYYDSLATTATTNATNVGSILATLEEGKDLTDDQIKQLDTLKEKYTDLADLQEEGGHAYLQRLREIQELEEDTAIEGLQKEAAALLEELNKISVDADTTAFDEKMDELMEVERKIKVAIEADFDSDIDQAFGLASEFEKIGSYIEDGLIISVDKAKEIIDAGYGAMLQGATTLKDGTIKLNEEQSKAFIEEKKDEVEADKRAKISQLEQDKEVLEGKKKNLEDQNIALQKALASGDVEKKKSAIVDFQLAYAQYSLNSDLAEAESEDEVDALENSEKNYEEYTKRINQLTATQAIASIKGANQTGESGVHALNQVGQTAAAVSRTIGAIYTGEANYNPLTYNPYTETTGRVITTKDIAAAQASGKRNAVFEHETEIAKLAQDAQDAQDAGLLNSGSWVQAHPNLAKTYREILKANKTDNETNESETEIPHNAVFQEFDADEIHYADLALNRLNYENLLEKNIQEAAINGMDIIAFLDSQLNTEIATNQSAINDFTRQIGTIDGTIAALMASGVALDNLLAGLDGDSLIDIAHKWHYLTKQLEYLNHLLNLVKTRTEEAYGTDKVKAYSEQLDILNRKLSIQTQMFDVQAGAIAGYKDKLDELFGAGVIEWDDESGNIINYWNLEQLGLSDEQKEALEKYEEILSSYQSASEELANLNKEYRDLELTQLTYDISFRIEIDENNLNRLEYILKKFEDDPQTMVEQINYLDDKVKVYIAEAERYQEALGRIYEIAAAEQRTLTDAEVQQVQEYQKNLLTTNEKLQELLETIRGSFMDEIEEFSSKISDQTARFDTYSKIIDHYTNIIKLSGRESRDSGLLIEIAARKTALAFEDLNVAYGEYQTLLAAKDELQKLYDFAETDEDREYWADELEEMEKKIEEAHEGMLASWSETLEAASEEFDTRIETTIQKLKDSISAYGLENLSDRYTKAKDINEQYLSELDKEYKLNKLIRQIENSIDETDNIAAKEALNKLLDEQNKKLEKGVQLSQYDLDVANAQYELELARIALEEAQNAKSTVRLTRDSEGNYGYVYTADQNAVDDAEQNYEDKLYKLRKLSEDYIDDLSDKIIKNEEDLTKALAEINEEDYETTEEYQAELDRIKAYYLEKDRYYRTELAKAVEDLGLKYHDTILGNLEDVSSWEEAHNNLAVATDATTAEMVEAWELWKSQTELAMSTVGTSADEFSDTVQTDLDDVAQAGKDLEADLGLYLTSSGEYFESLGEKIAAWSEATVANIRDVIAASEELAAVTALTEDDFDMDTDYSLLMVENFVKGDKTAYLEAAARRKAKESVNPDITNAITDRIMDVLEAYDDATHPKHDKAVEMVDKVLAGKLYFTDDSLSAYGFRTGGYTGDWGPEGKLAFLHEKELVLNQDDTENLLKTITFLRELVAMLNSQAAFSSFSDLSSSRFVSSTQPFEQVVTIQAEFPGVSDRYEIEEAFNTLVNRASQYANRK